MGLSDDLREMRRKDVEAVNDTLVLAEGIAVDRYAPRGATENLVNNIQAIPAEVTPDGLIIGVLTSSALSEKGFNYAALQHDEERRHVANQPLSGRSFADFGLSGSQQKRYRQGYLAIVGITGRFGRPGRGGAPSYATKYLDRALDDAEPHLDGRLNR